jgi:hypothetical protein
MAANTTARGQTLTDICLTAAIEKGCLPEHLLHRGMGVIALQAADRARKKALEDGDMEGVHHQAQVIHGRFQNKHVFSHRRQYDEWVALDVGNARRCGMESCVEYYMKQNGVLLNKFGRMRYPCVAHGVEILRGSAGFHADESDWMLVVTKLWSPSECLYLTEEADDDNYYSW